MWDAGVRSRGSLTPTQPMLPFEPTGRFSRGFALARKSWHVIRDDRSLLVLPILQIVTQAVAVAVVVGPIGYEAYQNASRYLFLIGLAAVAFPLNLLSTFFGVAFVAVLRAHLDGQRMSVGDALRFAGSRIDAITGWALLNTFVGLVTTALEQVRGGAIFARIAGWILDVTWAVAALFVLPALATEGVGPIVAAKKSAAVVKRKWPEGIVGATAIGVAFGFFFIPFAIAGGVGWAVSSHAPAVGVVLMAVAAAGLLLLTATQAAVDGVFRFVLFDYAANGKIHAPFAEVDLDSGVKAKSSARRSLRDWSRPLD